MNIAIENLELLLKDFSYATNMRYEIFAILPELYLVTACLIALLALAWVNVPSLNNKTEVDFASNGLHKFCMRSLFFTLILCFIQYLAQRNEIHWMGYTTDTGATCAAKIVLILVMLIQMKATQNLFKGRKNGLNEYPVLLLLLTIFILVVVASYNFITVYLSMLGAGLILYILALAINPHNHASREAAIKYFYLSTLSTGVMLIGIFFVYFIFNTTNFMAITWLIENWTQFDNIEPNAFLLTVMLYFIIFGFLFKLAAFPCHIWAPEVYDGTPNAVTMLLVLPIKIATFVIFLKILGHTFGDLYQYWHYIIWFSSMFSMIWGCLGALTAQTVKRFIAYSSINQMGFLLMGVACGTFEGFRAALIYLLLYVIMNVGFFVLFLATKDIKRYRSLTYITDFNDFAQRNHIYSVGLVVILFSMAGIPPLGGFFGKYFIFLHSFETGHIGLVIVGMITSVIGAFYYLRIIKIMWFEKPIRNRFKFETNMNGWLYEVFIAVEFSLIVFLLGTPWVVSSMNTITTLTIHPLTVWLWQ